MKIRVWVSRNSYGVVEEDQKEESCASCSHSSVCRKLAKLRKFGEEIDEIRFDCDFFDKEKD